MEKKLQQPPLKLVVQSWVVLNCCKDWAVRSRQTAYRSNQNATVQMHLISAPRIYRYGTPFRPPPFVRYEAGG